IYARIFTPEEFGILASVQVFVLFFQMIAEIGIGPAIINEDRFTNKQRDGIFTVTLILGVVLGSGFYFFSYFLNSFYGNYNYQQISIIISISIFFYALGIIPITSLNKDARFIKIAKLNILSEVLSFIIVYYLYYLNFGIFALVAKSLTQSFFNFILFWIESKETTLGRPLFGNQIYHIKAIASFASYQFFFNFINYFSRNLDNILIGKYLGMSSLGVYDKSYQLMRYPLMVTTFAMTPAIQPVLTKMRTDVVRIVEEHNKLTMRLLFISILISAFLYVNSQEIVLFLFGEQWGRVVPLIKVFAFMIPIQAVLSTSGSFYQVMNKPKLLFISGAISASINTLAIIIGVYSRNLEYIALALLISFTLNFIQCYYLMFKFCFYCSSRMFVIGLIKASVLSGFPAFFYVVVNKMLFNSLPDDVWLNLMLNIILAILCVGVFYSPIKKLFVVIK
ncbi:oligosaccharide flippase family protein, partial [Photobacterium phosphoreum]